VGGNGLDHLLGQVFDENQRGDEHVRCGHIGLEVGVVLGVAQFLDQVTAQLDRQGSVLVVERVGRLGEGMLVLGFEHHIHGLHHGPAVHLTGADAAVGGANLREHAQLGRRLFWLDGISDEYLERVYGCCRGLLAASEDEGFGLPLIEAAQHGLPILARDIPVFREVAGEHARFFQADEPIALAQAMQDWIADGFTPASRRLPWLTWKQSAANLASILAEQGC